MARATGFLFFPGVLLAMRSLVTKLLKSAMLAPFGQNSNLGSFRKSLEGRTVNYVLPRGSL